MNFKITIVGVGQIGRALEYVLREKQIALELWDRDISKVPGQKSLPETVSSADVLFLCAPSWNTREAILAISPHLRPKTAVVSLAKGIEAKTRKTIPELLEELLPRNLRGILSGPMLAEELISGKGGLGVVVGSQEEISHKISALFSKTSLQIVNSNDFRGVALAGTLKNIYAISLGIVEGLGWGMNRSGWLISDAIAEMRKVVELLGGQTETVLGPAGMGDFVATCFSPHSQNKEVGIRLSKPGTLSLQSEGVASLPSMIELVGEYKRNFPLLCALERTCINGEDAMTVFAERLL